MEEPFAYKAAEDGISQEFKPLVVCACPSRLARCGNFIHPRTMSQRPLEERTIFEAVRQSGFQLFETCMHNR